MLVSDSMDAEASLDFVGCCSEAQMVRMGSNHSADEVDLLEEDLHGVLVLR